MNAYLATLRAASVSNPVRRSLNVTPRIIDAAQGTVEYVASDETLDYYKEIVRVSGWRFDNFQKNAPFVDSHDYSCIGKLLGRVESWKIDAGQLVETVRYALTPDGNTLADWAFKLVRDGFLKAVSVGFVPTSMVSKWDQDQKDFLQQIADMKLDAQMAAQVRVIYREQQQIELSQCIIGANPNALAKAYKAGCLSEHDLDSLCALQASSETDSPAVTSAPAGESPARTKLALLAAIQAHL